MGYEAAETDSPAFDILSSRWAQGVLTGALTLIPARSYPRWLRLSIIWAPTAIAASGGAYFAGNPEQVQKLTKQAAGRWRSAAVVLLPAAAVGTVASGAMAAAFWADGKLDRGLRRMRIPFPRAVMGAAAGTATWWMVTKENERERAQQEQ